MSITSLAEQYRRQDRWRRWDEALARLPLTPGQRVLDLGCGVGQMTARLSRLGVEVVGIDSNEELLTTARVDHPGIRFVHLDLDDLSPDRFGHVDGLWASFVPDGELAFDGAAAPDVLEAWHERLRRMAGLKMFMGERFDDFVRILLGTLSSPNHRSSARVCCVVARRED